MLLSYLPKLIDIFYHHQYSIFPIKITIILQNTASVMNTSSKTITSLSRSNGDANIIDNSIASSISF